MSDTQFVRNEDPHEVSLPEGSKVAKSRSAENPTPVIRQVIVDSDTLNVEEGGATRVSPITPTAQSSTNEPSNGGDAAPMSPASPISHQDSEPKKKAEVAPEMNFPARLIYLKIENDKVRSQLDELENEFNAGA